MKTLAADNLAEEIRHASKSGTQGGFPYEDCRNLALKAGVDYENLVSDLDTYFYDVWSPSNGINKLAKKPEAWLQDLKQYLEKPFFARYPQYHHLEAMINDNDMPELYRRLAAVDGMRRNLVLFLSQLLNKRNGFGERGF